MKTLRELYERLTTKIFMGLNNEKGQTMIEYALVAVLIAIVLVLIFRDAGVQSGISTAASKVSSALTD